MKKDEITVGLVVFSVLSGLYLSVYDLGQELWFATLMPIIGLVLQHYTMGVTETIEDDYRSKSFLTMWLYVILGVFAIGLGGVIGKNLVITQELSIFPASLYVSLVAIGEETIFRGFLYQWVTKQVEFPIAGIIASSFIFTVYHIWRYGTSLPNMFTVFLGGIILAAICRFTNRLWPSMLVHIINNLLSVI